MKYCPPIDLSHVDYFEIRRAVSTTSVQNQSDLDKGEIEAIALALELNARYLLIDERKGTFVAEQLGIAAIGVLGILIEAKRRRFIASVLPLIDRLVSEINFFVSTRVRRRVAVLVNEQD